MPRSASPRIRHPPSGVTVSVMPNCSIPFASITLPTSGRGTPISAAPGRAARRARAPCCVPVVIVPLRRDLDRLVIHPRR